LYALLFADHGLNTAEISSLLFIWSATSFLFEVPSGAWADTVSRRGLLVAGGLLSAGGFAMWTALPSYAGFALGFVMWGIGGALESGTFQALVYDDLATRGSTARYSTIIGFAASAAQACGLVGILAAAPLFGWGGYPLVGWVSVGLAALQAVLALTLPAAAERTPVGQVPGLDEDPVVPAVSADAGEPDGVLARYLGMIRIGLAEVWHRRIVRGGVFLASILFGYTALDEYFALSAEENGAATGTVPFLIALTFVGSLLGSMLAGRTSGMRPRTMAVALVLCGIGIGGGALLGGAGVVGVIGFVGVGIGYGILTNVVIVSEARVQESIEGPARATVMSVAGLLSEVVSVAIYGAFALGSLWLGTPQILAVVSVAIVMTALVVRRWLPGRT
jgi:MFS family permease